VCRKNQREKKKKQQRGGKKEGGASHEAQTNEISTDDNPENRRGTVRADVAGDTYWVVRVEGRGGNYIRVGGKVLGKIKSQREAHSKMPWGRRATRSEYCGKEGSVKKGDV